MGVARAMASASVHPIADRPSPELAIRSRALVTGLRFPASQIMAFFKSSKPAVPVEEPPITGPLVALRGVEKF